MDISAILLVGPQTSREDFKSLYYELYKLQRLPGSPLREPEWIEEVILEVVSSLEDHLGQKGGKPPWMMMEPDPIDIWPPRSKTPGRGSRDTSAERRLAKAREVHQRALATMATLEEEIEHLTGPSLGASGRPMPTPEARIAMDRDKGYGSGGTARCGWRRAMPLTLNITLPGGEKMRRLPWIST